MLQKTKFATLYGDRQVSHYIDGVYKPYGEDVIGAMLEKQTNGDKITIHLVKEVVSHIRRRTLVYRDDFDNDANIINMANGLYSIDGTFSPHTPKHLSLRKSPVVYDADATCPNIDKFIREVVAPDRVHTIYEIAGYSIASHKNLKRAFIFEGEKNSGKSAMIKLLASMIGKEGITGVSPLTVSRTTYGSAEYYGKQLNIVGDLGNTPIEDTGVLKSVITGEQINAKFLYAQPFDYTPDVLCVFATNEVPTTSTLDEAYASRFSIIRFPNLFEGDNDDPDIMDKLTTPEELSGFFNKSMNALKELRERGSFSGDGTLADRIKAYRESSDPTTKFIDEMCTLQDPDAYVLKDTLYRAYTAWSECNKTRTRPMKFLTMTLSEMGCVIRKVVTDDEERKRAYFGVDFKATLTDF